MRGREDVLERGLIHIRRFAIFLLCLAVSLPAASSATASSAVSGADSIWVPLTSGAFDDERARRAKPLGLVVAKTSTVPGGGSEEPLPAPIALSPEAPSDTPFDVSGTIRRQRPGSRVYQSHVPYTRTEITDPTTYPYVTHGRLFVSTAAGDGYCSGTIVPSSQGDMVITAGHCLILDEDRPPTGAWFAPGYRLGQAPYGYWSSSGWAVTERWAQAISKGSPDGRFDVGALRIDPSPDGTTLADAFGTRGITFGEDWRQSFTSFGYPAAEPFDGERLYSCASSMGFQDRTRAVGPFPIGMGCDMTPGSSGGGWVIGSGLVNSVVSYSYAEEPEVQFGPYFGSSAAGFYEAASGLDVPEVPADPVTHQMTLSISLSGHLVATGALRSADGYAACTRGAPVQILRKTPGGWRVVARKTTGSTGRFRAAVGDRPGRYVARSPEGAVDEMNGCSQSVSAIKTHRH